MSERRLIPNIATIPNRLKIEGRPELEIFPHNVLFGTLTEHNGEPVIATAVYEPDLESYRPSGKKILLYNNTLNEQMGKQWVVSITKSGKIWRAEKASNGQVVNMNTGRIWKDLFEKFTSVGLSIGEPCTFEPFSKYKR